MKQVLRMVCFMPSFLQDIVYELLIAFGVVVGASVFAGLGALINDNPPMKTMLDMAHSLKIWAVAIALGGTFSTLEVLDQGIWRGELKSILKQVIYIVTALTGSNLGYGFIKLIKICGELWME